MKDYKLITSDGETIATVSTHSQYEAIEYFSLLKKLPPDDLLNIFEVLIRD